MAQMTKNDYEAISNSFKKQLHFIQYLYAFRGISNYGTSEQKHSEEGLDWFRYFQNLDKIIFDIANNLQDANPTTFNRDKFLQSAGMYNNNGKRNWSFVPDSEYIKKVQKLAD